MVSSSVIFLLIGVLILAVVLILYISVVRKESPQLNREKYQAKWLAIENSVDRANVAACHMAILNADKLLDQALKDRHYSGDKMADRMKAAGKKWTKANNVWTAHKVRNRLAHEPEAVVGYELTLQALGAYKQALKDLGAI
jgi:hypothetical protein